MQPKHLIIPFILCLAFFSCKGPIKLNKPDPPAGTFVYGGDGDEAGRDLMELPDGSFLLLGATSSEGDNNLYDIYLVKTDAQGQELWSKTFGNEEMNETGCKIVATADGGYAIAGISANSTGQSFSYVIYKTDADFNVQWERRQAIVGGWSAPAQISGFFELAAGGYIMSIFSNQSLTVFVLGSEGNEFQRRPYAESFGSGLCETLNQLPDTSYVFGAMGYDPVNYQQTVSFYKLDKAGNDEYAYYMDQSPPNISNFKGLIALADGNFLAITSDYNNDNTYYNFNIQGVVQWSRAAESGIQFTNQVELADGSILFAATTGSPGDSYYYYDRSQPRDAVLIQVDSLGNGLRMDIHGLEENDMFFDVIQASDGRIVSFGHTSSYGKGNSDLFLVFTP